MGNSTWSSVSYSSYRSTNNITLNSSTHEVFKSNGMLDAYNPSLITMRESVKSAANPNPTPIIIGLDVTGSMSKVLMSIINNLDPLFTRIYNEKPVTDPHIMFMGIGDADARDAAPLQATQFEADICLVQQLQEIYIEQGGGGNGFESYILPWLFAKHKTKIDCMDSGRKGYIFTIGDESIQPRIYPNIAKRVLNIDIENPISAKEMFEIASEKYNIFHLAITETPFYKSNSRKVDESWRDVIGNNYIKVNDYNDLSNIIVDTISKNPNVLMSDDFISLRN